MYTTDHIFHVLPIKQLANQDSESATPHKLETSTKLSVSNLPVLFYPCVVQKATTHVDTKVLNMRHQQRKGFRGTFVGIPQQHKGCLIYVPSTWKIVSHMTLYFTKQFLVR